MTRRGQPPAGLQGPRRGRPALRSDPGHHHRALAEQWPGRCSITPLGFCSNGQQVTTKTFFILESHGWVNQRRERTKTRGNLGRAWLCCWSHHSPIHPAKVVVLQDKAIGKATVSEDTTFIMQWPHASPRRWHLSPSQAGKHSCWRSGLCRGMMPHHGASLYPPLSCPQRTTRDGKRKRCCFKDTISKELQIYSECFTGVLQTRTAPGGQFSPVNVMSVLFRDL